MVKLPSTSKTDLTVDMGIPGWLLDREIIETCRLTRDMGFDRIVEAGPYAGRLTWAMCKNFPDKRITVVDVFEGKSMESMRSNTLMTGADEHVIGMHQTEEYFRGIHDHDNLTIINSDYLKHQDRYDLAIISMWNESGSLSYTWEQVIDHSLSIARYVLAYSSQGWPTLEPVIREKYQYNMVCDDGILPMYLIKKKIDS